MSGEHREYNKPREPVKNYFQPADYPADTFVQRPCPGVILGGCDSFAEPLQQLPWQPATFLWVILTEAGVPITPGFGVMGGRSEGPMHFAAYRQSRELSSKPRTLTSTCAYFSALSRAASRDLYREAVFPCRIPFWIALSSADTVCR